MTSLKKITNLLLISTLLCCQDLLVKDISNTCVEILVPQNNTSISNSTVTFFWEPVTDADAYKIQIVSPTFADAQTLMYDSIITTNKITFALNPGNFEWRIKAINEISETEYTISKFNIDSTMNLSEEKLIQYSPTNGSALNSTEITFRWNRLYNADEYKFTLVNSFNETISEVKLTSPEYKLTVPENDVYQWCISANNKISSTKSFSSTFTIDTKSPRASTLKSPNNFETVFTDSITFHWSKIQDEGSEIIDSLIVAKDENLSDIVLSIKTSNTQYSDTIPAGIYYWTVINIDKAGNQCQDNKIYKFVKENL